MSEAKNFTPYETTHRLQTMLFVTTVVSEGQADSIVSINNKHEAAICCVCRGKGTATSEFMGAPAKKDVVFSLLRSNQWDSYKKALEARFSISKVAKGIAYCVPMDAVAGVSIYKMISNSRLFDKPTSASGTRKGRTKE